MLWKKVWVSDMINKSNGIKIKTKEDIMKIVGKNSLNIHYTDLLGKNYSSKPVLFLIIQRIETYEHVSFDYFI